MIVRSRCDSKRFQSKVNAYKQEYEEEHERLVGEIARLNFIISDYQKKIFSADAPVTSVQDNQSESSVNIAERTIADLNADKEKMELERSRFQEKNKKLWEQSIAVHREMERINALKKEIESEHKQILDSIMYAKRIQSALLPQDAQVDDLLKEYFIYWQPRDIVSGDFYWMKKVGEKIIIVVADCTGHGVPGAFMSALGISFLNEIILHQHDELKADYVLEEMRRLVKSSLNQTGAADEAKDGMDMSACIYDKVNLKIDYAGANHSMLHYRDGEILEYNGVRNPVGIYLKEKKFETQEIKVLENDVFYLFSDGYLDEFGGELGHKFKKQNFRKLILDMNDRKVSMADQHKEFEATMTNWLGTKYKQIDDILVVGFKA